MGREDVMAAAENGYCKGAKAAFKSAKNGREKAKLSIDIIDSCGLGGYARLAEFDAAFGTSFDSGRRKLPKGALDTVVLFFDPQKSSADDSMASAYTGWYLSIKYSSNGLVLDYMISSAHK